MQNGESAHAQTFWDAVSANDEDAVLSIALEDAWCNETLLRLVQEGLIVFPRMASVVRHLDIVRYPIIAVDILGDEFSSNPRDPDLIKIARHVVDGKGSWANQDAIMSMLTSIVCRAVLSFMTSIDRNARAVDDECIATNMAWLIRDYQLIYNVHFRTHGGISNIVHLLGLTCSLPLHLTFLELLDAFPEYVFHCPPFARTLVLLISGSSRRRGDIVRTLFSKYYVVPTLVMMSRCIKDDGFDMLLRLVRELLGAQLFFNNVISSWPTRFGCNPAENTVYEYECPITLDRIRVPCVASDGFTYEQSVIMDILGKNASSPMTRERLDIRVVFNDALT